jgi:beta-N-acetylhexosaminidase
MDVEGLAAQVLLSAVEGRELGNSMRLLFSDIPTGGIMLFRYNISPDPEASARFLKDLSLCISGASSGLSPFIATDQEGGAVQRFRGNASLPPALSYWERFEQGEGRNSLIAEAEADALRSGRELRRLGVNFNLAPVAEILYGENAAFLKDRSYGPDPLFTRDAASAFIRGMERAGVACTVKHFPGNSGADPHKTRGAKLPGNAAELAKMIEPFRGVIAGSRPAAVMVSHVIVPSWDTRPASLSPEAVRQLRGNLGFQGIIIADDFAMAAAPAPVEVCAVDALNAGVDMVMAWTKDLRKVHTALVASVREGRLDVEKLRRAAERIIFIKLRYGLIQ